MPTLPFLLALLLTALPLFLPHRRNQPGAGKPTTLAAIYRDFFAQVSFTIRRLPRILLFLWILASIITTYLPPFLFLLLRIAPPTGPLTRAALLMAGIIALAGAPGNFLIVILNASTFTFGTPPPIGPAFPFACIIAALHLLLALTTLALALSPTLAAHAHRLLS
jgi:hypothetical protein